MLPFQAGVNAQLSQWVGSPIRAAFASFVIGAAALLALSALVFKPLPTAASEPPGPGHCVSRRVSRAPCR